MTVVFVTLYQKEVSDHRCLILLINNKSLGPAYPQEKEIIQNVNTRRQGYCRLSWRLPTTVFHSSVLTFFWLFIGCLFICFGPSSFCFVNYLFVFSPFFYLDLCSFALLLIYILNTNHGWSYELKPTHS